MTAASGKGPWGTVAAAARPAGSDPAEGTAADGTAASAAAAGATDQAGAAVPSAWASLRQALGGDPSPAAPGPGRSGDPGGGPITPAWEQLGQALRTPQVAGGAVTAVPSEPTGADPAGVADASIGETGIEEPPVEEAPVGDAPVEGALVDDVGGDEPTRSRRGLLGTRRRRLTAAGVAVVVAAGAVAGGLALGGGGGGLPGGSAFSVDGTVVTQAQFATQLQVRQTLYGIQPPAQSDTARYHAFLTSAAQAEAVSLLLDHLAPGQGVTVSTQTAEQSLNAAVQTQYGGSQAAFATALGNAGLNAAQVLSEVQHNLVYRRLFAKVVGTPGISQADISQYFTAHQAQLAVPETRELSHIVVSTQSAAQGLLGQLSGGADFATLAAAQSLDGATKANGGRLGTYSKADLQPAFATAAFSAAEGVPFGPVQDQSDWEIGVATAIHPGHPATLDPTTASAIKTLLTDQAEASRWDAWLGGQLRKALIVYAAAYRPAHPDQPPVIPVPQLTGETLAGVGPATAAPSAAPATTPPAATPPATTAPAPTTPGG